MFITLEAPEAPIGLDLDDFQRVLLPTYKSGIVVRVGTRATYSVEGTILLADGKALVFKSGAIVSIEVTESAPIAFFTDEHGVFQAYGLLPGSYGIKLKEGEPYTGIFILPEEAGLLFPVGIFRMTAPAEKGY
jgi:outer membrane usher protein